MFCASRGQLYDPWLKKSAFPKGGAGGGRKKSELILNGKMSMYGK